MVNGKKTRPKFGRLPARVRLGFGYVIRVVLLTPAQLADQLEQDETHTSAGWWDDEDMAIYIDGSVSRARQRKAYWHELVHCIHDLSLIDEGGI